MLNTTLTREWGLKYPFIQAPMANVAGGELAAAVSRAGGLGMLGTSSTTPVAWVAAEAEKARRGGRFGIGLMGWALPDRPDLLDAVLAEKPFLVSISFGDPAPYAEKVKASGALLAVQVQNSEIARQALAAGADLLVAQGSEAGGHTGSVGTFPITQLVLEMTAGTDVPVLAAGGIASGHGIAGALAMGCAGAWVGTPFIATEEATNSEASRARLLRASESDTVHTRVFDMLQELAWPPEFPGRALTNDMTARWHGHEDELAARLGDVQTPYEAARKTENYDIAHIYAGQSAGLIRQVVPAARLVEQLMTDAERILRATTRDLLS